MTELIFLLPILAPIALILGATRATELGPILKESSRSFVKMVGAIVLLCVGLQVVLYLVPLVF
jgi:hypothetical protein